MSICGCGLRVDLLARHRLCAVSDVGCGRPVPRAAGRFAPRPCLLDVAAVCLDASPPSSHRSRAWLRAVLPMRSSARASPRFAPVIAAHAWLRSVPWRLASPPRLIDTTGGVIR